MQKISQTQFSRPAPDEVIDVEAVARKKAWKEQLIKELQAEIAEYDIILDQAKTVGIEITNEEIK